MQDNHGAILLISGPSGCGKSTLLKEVYKDISEYYFSISTTTRAPREGATNGVDYFFVSKEDFEKDIKDKNFLEYANVHGNYYGTSLKPVKEALKDGKLVIFDIDVQGHDLVKKTDLCSFLTSIFITTPTLKELESRLNNRATDSKDIIAKRVKNAKIEINSIDKYDYFLINDNLDDASKKLVSIANAARIKASLFNKKQIISEWMN